MKVRIYRPAKNTMQSSLAKTRQWVLESELETPREPEPLMGWISSGDTLNQIRLKFPTREQAVAHAAEQGWTILLDNPHDRIVEPRNYADNFRYVPPKESGKS